MDQNIRLPKVAIPNRYEIHLDVDLDNFSYIGKEIIYLEIVDQTNEIQLNSLGIIINGAFLENDSGQHVEATVNYLSEEERISLSLEEKINPGDWKLFINFQATITNDLRGFYRSSYSDENGVQRWIGTTQFEPTGARLAFPCWDEPEYKAVFSITISTLSKFVRISNEKILNEIVEKDKTTTKFVDSMRMSTYLVAFVVGPLEVTNIGNSNSTEVRIVHKPGFAHQTSFAGTAAIKILDFFEEYYEIPYPGSKLDLISVPDFAMGAMENIGAITFRENLLLIDEKKATRSELSRSVEVIAHELAHMWFGDLVTMNWWDGIWLNEAFASLMEVIASEATYPEFKLWNELNLARSAGFSVDSLKSSRPVEFEVNTPEEAEEMFDVLTYQKGSTVLRMFETFIGEENFKKGVRNYLKKHQFKNTHSSDLWEELTNSSNYQLDKILPTWIKQEGYPLITVKKVDSEFLITQNKFLLSGESDESLWKVPLNIRTLDSNKEYKEMLETNQTTLQFEGSIPFVNNGGWSFFHTHYDEEILENILKNFHKLDTNEKYRLLEDSWMNLRTNNLSVESFVNVLNHYSNEFEKNIWSLLSTIFTTLDKISTTENFRNYVKLYCMPMIEKLGSSYEVGLDQETSQLKSIVCSVYASVTRDQEFIKNFSDQFKSNKYIDYVDGNYFNLVLNISAMDDSNSADTYLEKFTNSNSPQMQSRFRGVLGLLDDPESPQKIINAVLNKTIRGADAPYVLAMLIANSKNAKKSWETITENWVPLLKIMPEWTTSRILDLLPSVYDEELSKDIISFLDKNSIPSAEKITKQKLERLRANIKFKNSIQKELNNGKF